MFLSLQRRRLNCTSNKKVQYISASSSIYMLSATGDPIPIREWLEIWNGKGMLTVLIEYNNAYEKVALDLLSFMSDEHQLKALPQTMQKYEENSAWQLYLLKQEDGVVGAIGIEVAELTFTVLHASVNSSYRNEGIGHAMIKKVQELQEPRAMRASMETKEFLAKCWETAHPL